jgi:serine protease Do
MKQNLKPSSVVGFVAAGIIAVAGAFGAGLLSAGHVGISEARGAVPAALPATGPSTGVLLPDFTQIVARNGPAVVNVSVTQKAKVESSGGPFPGMDPDDPFYQFFRHFGMPMPHGGVPVRGMGSGFIIDPGGTILTNAHVVDGASEVTVKLNDKREFRAKVTGLDKQSDIAVLKIDATGLPTVKLGSAANVKVGEWVVAIGSPFGFENSVTSGIVSAKSRALPDENYVPFIQTDVAVNPGNSGGPLFNMNGEVIGINSQIYSRTGGYQGLSFAIPIDMAIKVKDQLQQYGKVSRGRLGISIQEVNQKLADSFGLKHAGGALVSSVDEDGPAGKAGMKPGDVILKLNGEEVAQYSELPLRVADLKPGSKASLEVWRNGGTRTLDVTVGELAKSEKVATNDSDSEGGRLGVAVRPLSPDERHAVGSSGLVVEAVSGAAARAGILPGDVLLSVNNTPVRSIEQLRSTLGKAGKNIALLVQRDNAKIFIPVDLSAQG